MNDKFVCESTPKKVVNVAKNKKNNFLSFSPFTLQRHPSAKHLNKSQEKSEKSEKCFTDLSIPQIKDNDQSKSKENIQIGIDQVEHKIYSISENFYIKNENPVSKSSFQKKKTISQKNLSVYGFTEEQLKIDEIITKKMQNGKDFKDIETNFIFLPDEVNNAETGEINNKIVVHK